MQLDARLLATLTYLSGNAPAKQSYGFFVSQLIGYVCLRFHLLQSIPQTCSSNRGKIRDTIFEISLGSLKYNNPIDLECIHDLTVKMY